MLAAMTAADLAEWLAWERVIGPIGTPREDYRHAAAAASICSVLIGKRSKLKNSQLIPFECPWGASSGSGGVYHLKDPRDQVALFAAMAGVPIPEGARKPDG